MQKLQFPFLFYGTIFLLVSSCGSSDSRTAIATDSLSVADGEILFQKNCSGCHNFKQDGIGPALSGITETDSIQWLKKFIRSPKEMIDAGDPHAGKLAAVYHSMMPSFPDLSGHEMDQLMAFLHARKAVNKPDNDSLAIRNPVPEKIEASSIEVALDLFCQIPASSEKEPLTRISKMDWVDPIKSWFVLDQRGLLYKLINQQPALWLDISKYKPGFINQPGLATGFGSIAFHPEFEKNGLFYTTHSELPHTKKADFAIPDSINQTLQWVLCEWKTDNPSASSFSGTSREILRVDMVAGIHGFQEIAFNPTAKKNEEDYGKLYLGIGDGGSVENGYPFLTQHPAKIWGTIIRIDPLGKNSNNKQYGIPSSNPFVKNANPHDVSEIYADGFRNPNKFNWIRNNIMLTTNIGQSNIEAIDIALKGQHYGWPIREGRFSMNPTGNINHLYPLPKDDSNFHITYPVAVYDHDEGNAIAGGYLYLGHSIPALTGKYLFGDIPTGRLFYVNIADLQPGHVATVKEWFVSLHGKRQSLQEICGQSRVDLRFSQDEKGEIYLFTKPDGKIYRLVKN